MPLFQYTCKSCGKQFEELVRKFGDRVTCPVCGGEGERSWSGTVHSATGKPSKQCSGNCSCCSGCK